MSLELFDLAGRRALVTGSTQGIGLTLARGLAAAGAEVVLNGRDGAKLDAAVAGIAGARGLAFDVTDAAAVRAAVFLASEASAFVTGQIINADGGATHP